METQMKETMTPLTEITKAYNAWQDADAKAKLKRANLKQKILNARDERYTFQRIADVLKVTPQAISQITKKESK